GKLHRDARDGARSGVPEEEEGSRSVGDEGSELHSAVLKGDVSPGDFILVCARGLATRSRLITAPRLDSSPASPPASSLRSVSSIPRWPPRFRPSPSRVATKCSGAVRGSCRRSPPTRA